jgi:tetratricopeptide (TPR) repeat protein
LALKLYNEALKLQPDFPEAEYQRGAVFISLNRPAEAVRAFRRAIELRSDWALPQATLGALLLRADQLTEAEKLLSGALELDAQTSRLLVSLASGLRGRAQGSHEATAVLLKLLRRVTEDKNATTEQWTARGWTEEFLGDKAAALASFQKAISLDAQNYRALISRAQLRAHAGDFEGAIVDAQAARRFAPDDAAVNLQSISIYLQAGKKEEARRAWNALDEATKQQPEAAALLNAMLSCEDSPENRAALEKALAASPRDAQILSCLGAAYRRADPSRSLDFYRRAADIEPDNISLAVGYTAALVQSRRFDEAVVIARRVLALAPGKYEAHANLATALYELKRFPEALNEFRWLAEAKPNLAATHFFIATAHDYLGEYPEALAAYETFLARADAQANKLEIEKVNLRLPSLRNQIKRGEGKKK